MTFDYKIPIENRINPPQINVGGADRVSSSRATYAKIIIFHSVLENFGAPSGLRSDIDSDAFFATETIEITDSIASLGISKNINQPSASFQFSLHPSKNWKALISPGDWLCIYLFPSFKQFEAKNQIELNKNLMLIGNVDRIARVVAREEESDEITLRYNVSGKNFGKVFESTDIWFDPYTTQDKTLDVVLRTAGLEMVGTPDGQINQILNVFMGGGAEFKHTTFTGRTSPLGQWVIPKELASWIGMSSTPILESGDPSFYDIMDRRIEINLPGYKTRNSITVDDNGSLWDMLDRSSNSLINEIFLEETKDEDGNVRPTITLRPRPVYSPFLESNFGTEGGLLDYPLNGMYKSFQNFATINYLEIAQSEIIYEDLGRDDLSRFNMFILGIRSEFEYMLSRMTHLNFKGAALANPLVIRESIKRYGLKRFDQLLEYVHNYVGSVDSETRDLTDWVPTAVPEINLLKGVLGLVYDLHFANHMYESGTIECTAIPEAELGKTLIILPQVEGGKKKIYYIEGYEHTWEYPNTWRTSFTLTHGQFLDSNKPFIDAHNLDKGQEDKDIQSRYVAQTFVNRDGQT